MLFSNRELRRVHADHHQSLVLVLLGPGADIGQRAQPVDAGVGPEIDEHDLAAQAGGVSGGELSHASARSSEASLFDWRSASGKLVKERHPQLWCHRGAFISPTKPAIGAPIAVASTTATRSGSFSLADLHCFTDHFGSGFPAGLVAPAPQARRKAHSDHRCRSRNPIRFHMGSPAYERASRSDRKCRAQLGAEQVRLPLLPGEVQPTNRILTFQRASPDPA